MRIGLAAVGIAEQSAVRALRFTRAALDVQPELQLPIGSLGLTGRPRSSQPWEPPRP